jgi:hypothetical protein
MRADIASDFDIGMRASFLQTHLRRRFNSFSSQVLPTERAVGLGTKPFKEGMIFPTRPNGFARFDHAIP